MKRQQFTKQNIGAFREAMQKALDVAGEACGVAFHVGSITYNPQSCRIGVKAANLLDGKAQVQEELDFIRHAPRYGFKKEDLFRTFTDDNGHRCTITGFLPRRRKYPVQYRDNDIAKTFVGTPRYIQRLLGIKPVFPELTELTITDAK